MAHVDTSLAEYMVDILGEPGPIIVNTRIARHNIFLIDPAFWVDDNEDIDEQNIKDFLAADVVEIGKKMNKLPNKILKIFYLPWILYVVKRFLIMVVVIFLRG